jgi:hypothetical protein
VSISLPSERQKLSLVDEQFEVTFIYSSESPIILESIDDGDISLLHTNQAGQLVDAVPSLDGKEMTATFAFDRDVEAGGPHRGHQFGRAGQAFAFRLGVCAMKQARFSLVTLRVIYWSLLSFLWKQ